MSNVYALPQDAAGLFRTESRTINMLAATSAELCPYNASRIALVIGFASSAAPAVNVLPEGQAAAGEGILLPGSPLIFEYSVHGGLAQSRWTAFAGGGCAITVIETLLIPPVRSKRRKLADQAEVARGVRLLNEE